MSLTLDRCYELCEEFAEDYRRVDRARAARYVYRCRKKCRTRGVPAVPLLWIHREARRGSSRDRREGRLPKEKEPNDPRSAFTVFAQRL